MSVEVVVSLGAAWMAHSPALLGFGGDSAVELLSAAVVLWRFSSPSHAGELGGPACRFGSITADPTRGMGGDQRQAMLPHNLSEVLVEKASRWIDALELPQTRGPSGRQQRCGAPGVERSGPETASGRALPGQ